MCERGTQDVPHRDTDAAPVQRVRGGRAEEHAVHAHAGSVAEDGPDVLVVADPLQNHQRARALDYLAHAERLRFVGGDQQAAVHVVPGDFPHDLAGDLVDRHAARFQFRAVVLHERGKAATEAVDGANREAGFHQPARHQRSFREHQVLFLVGVFEVADVVESGVCWVVDGVQHLPDRRQDRALGEVHHEQG